MHDPELRPIDVGTLLETAGRIYFNHIAALLGITALLVGPVQAIGAVLQRALVGDQAQSPFETPRGDAPPEIDPEQLVALIAVGVGTALLQLLATSVATGAAVAIVGGAYIGGSVGWRDALGYAWSHAGRLVLIALLVGVVAGIGLLLFILPGIWLGVAFVVAVPAALVERSRPVAALRRSFRLVRGRWWPTFGTLLLAWLVAAIVAAIPALIYTTAPAVLGDDEIVATMFAVVGSLINSLLVTPFVAVIVAVIYFDLRARKEEVTLGALRAQLAGSGAASMSR